MSKRVHDIASWLLPVKSVLYCIQNLTEHKGDTGLPSRCFNLPMVLGESLPGFYVIGIESHGFP